MRLISFPFRFEANGSAATVEQDSDAATAEQIAVLLLTRRSERPLVPDFGVVDMVGRGLDPSELAAALGTYGPDVELLDVAIDEVGDGVQQVTVTFD